MTISEFYKFNTTNFNGFNGLNDDVNVYLDDDDSNVFNDLVAKCGNPNFYIVEGIEYFNDSRMIDFYVVTDDNTGYTLFFKDTVEMSQVYESLIKAMEYFCK